MIFETLEIGIAVSSAAYLSFLRMRFRRQRAVAWDTLVAQLKPSRLGSESGHTLLFDGNRRGLSWQRIQDARGLWEMYENAGVILRMADYAARAGELVDTELLEQLRNDATQIRIYIFYALSEHVRSHVTEEARANIASVTAIYCDMVSRMSGLIQVNDGMLNQSFAGSI
jgi:hypothetical protein